VRIVHLATGRDWAGGTRPVVHLVRALAALDVPQVVVTSRESALDRQLAAAPVPDVEVHALPWRTALDPRALPGILHDLRADSPDGGPTVVHAHDSPALALASFVHPADVPLVVSRRSSRPVTRAALWRRADLVIATSEAARGQLLAQGLAPEAVVVVAPGVPTRALPAPAGGHGVRQRLGLAPGTPLAVSVGTLAAEDRLPMLVEAASRLAAISPELHWVVAGVGPRRASLLRRARQLGVSSRLHLLGPIDAPERLVAEATVFVLPGTRDLLAPWLLEAMALGVPIVAAAVGGVREIVGENAGLLVPRDAPATVADGVHRLLVEPAFADVLVRAARARAAEFDAARMATAHLAVYRSLDSHS